MVQTLYVYLHTWSWPFATCTYYGLPPTSAYRLCWHACMCGGPIVTCTVWWWRWHVWSWPFVNHTGGLLLPPTLYSAFTLLAHVVVPLYCNLHRICGEISSPVPLEKSADQAITTSVKRPCPWLDGQGGPPIDHWQCVLPNSSHDSITINITLSTLYITILYIFATLHVLL